MAPGLDERDRLQVTIYRKYRLPVLTLVGPLTTATDHEPEQDQPVLLRAFFVYQTGWAMDGLAWAGQTRFRRLANSPWRLMLNWTGATQPLHRTAGEHQGLRHFSERDPGQPPSCCGVFSWTCGTVVERYTPGASVGEQRLADVLFARSCGVRVPAGPYF